jgi:hypothetical protein
MLCALKPIESVISLIPRLGRASYHDSLADPIPGPSSAPGEAVPTASISDMKPTLKELVNEF